MAKDSSNYINVLFAVHTSNYNNFFAMSPLEITVDLFPLISMKRNGK